MLLRLALFNSGPLPFCHSKARRGLWGAAVQSVDKWGIFNVDGFGKVHLAGVSCPDIMTMEGVRAKEFALENLVG